MRKEFTKKTRTEVFLRAKGKCEKCGANLKVGEGEYDHVIPAALGGGNELSNAELLCRPCHRDPGAKTAADVKAIAKSKRRAENHSGVSKPAGKLTSAPFPTSDKAKRVGKTPLAPRRLYQETQA